MAPVNAEAGVSKQLHVLFYPWLAYGHITPHIELGKRLSTKGIKVSFFSTHGNIQNLRSSSPGIENVINLIGTDFPSIEGLENGKENTSNLENPHEMVLLKRAMDAMQTPFENILKKLSPDLVFFDMFNHWVPSCCTPIPAILFTPFSATCHAFAFRKRVGGIEEYYTGPEGFPSTTIYWKPYELQYAVSSEKPSELERVAVGINECSAIIFKSTEQLEGKFIDFFRSEMGKPVLPVGPLLPYGMQKVNSHRCLEWLDGWGEYSVIYVAFGSEAILPDEVSHALAFGLEQSNVPFLWAARPNVALPQGFLERVIDRGLLTVGEWVPQKEILKHRAVGGFLSHCGWSSFMESLSCGVAELCLVVASEGGLNLRLIVDELELGVGIHRGEDGSLDADSVCRGVRELMVEEKGLRIKNKAKDMEEVFRTQILNEGGLQEQYVNDVVRLIQGLNCGSDLRI